MTNQYFEWLKMGTIALGVVIAVIAILFLFKATKGRKADGKNLAFNITSTAVIALCLAVILTTNYFIGIYTQSINAVMTKQNATEESTDIDDWKELAYNIADEGMVLLENNGSTLPLSSGTKVNLLGYYAYNPIYSGSGSGSVSASDAVSIADSLTNAGIEVNPAVEASGIYGKDSESDGESIGFMTASFSIDEVSIDSYTGDVSFDSLAAYSDTAIVVIGRSGGEGADLTAYEDGDYLALNEDELALLSAARENFSTVIVVLDCANAIQIGFVDEYEVDAVIWAGIPGPYGFESLGQILTGAVNPSGHLPDTWVYDNDSNPVNENFGEQEASNAAGRYYVDYVEGIYVGYKWYETAYAEQAVVTNTETGEIFDFANHYDSIVAYPFGYGLSYTTFSQEITGGTLTNGAALDATGSYTIEVTVTNDGDVAGKSVIQLYVTAPYTDYDKVNGVEKAAVSLVNYGKTDILQPGESAVVTLDVNMEEIASYDSSHDNGDGTVGCYMLDAGDYTFSVRSDAHTALDQVTALMEDQYFFSGDNKRSSDQVVAINQFDDATRGEYLSRQDGFANYVSAMASVVDTVGTDYATTTNLYDSALDAVVTKEYVEGVDYAASGDLTLADLAGADYDDERWTQLISQMTIQEMLDLTGQTLYGSVAIDSIDKGATTDSDGPLGISSMFSSDLITVAFPSTALLSATFSKDLAYEMGSCVADQGELNNITAWYAPAMDTHRSPYSGRNFEYYSEDATLGAYTASNEVLGAAEKGQLMYIKHFFLNDMETHRAAVHTYSNEQAIREIYLKPFEYAIKYGGATGVMNSMNYVGDVYSGAHVGLLTNVLRGEWGFVGSVLTDMDEGGEFRSFMSTLRAGVDIWLGFTDDKVDASSVTDADIYYLQRAAHNELYFLASGGTIKTAEILDWQSYRTAIYVELGVLAAACAVSLVLRNRKKKQD